MVYHLCMLVRVVAIFALSNSLSEYSSCLYQNQFCLIYLLFLSLGMGGVRVPVLNFTAGPCLFINFTESSTFFLITANTSSTYYSRLLTSKEMHWLCVFQASWCKFLLKVKDHPLLIPFFCLENFLCNLKKCWYIHNLVIEIYSFIFVVVQMCSF